MTFSDKRATELMKEKIQARIGHRPDLNLTDWRLLDANTAIFVIAYNKGSGEVDMSELQTMINKEFNGKVIAHLKTANIHDEGAISVVASIKRTTRPAADAEKMTKVVANTFLDSRLDETWEMDVNRGVLSRVLDEDLSTILEERRKRMSPTHAHLTVASLIETKAPNLIEIGDVAKFVQRGKVMEGEVIRVMPDAAKLKLSTGETVELDKAALFNIKAGKGADKKQKQIQMDYYSKLYGLEFARLLVGP